MDRTRTSEDAIRWQILEYRRYGSAEIARALAIPHDAVVRVLRRLARQRCFALDEGTIDPAGRITVVEGSLSDGFKRGGAC